MEGDAEPLLRVERLVKRYGELTVLDELSFDVASGEVVAIIGPSGSGKSTLLRVLMLLESVDGGGFRVDSDAIEATSREAEIAATRRHFGMVFQHFNLFPHRTALDNVTLALEVVQRRPREEARAIGRELLTRVGLEDKLDAFPARLSGGQKQRVAIARALAPQPDIVLFDEITSALDPEWVGEVLAVLEELAAERSTTMLIVTHEIGFARRIADRILFLDGGRIAAELPPEQLADPRQARLREFLGTIVADAPTDQRHPDREEL